MEKWRRDNWISTRFDRDQVATRRRIAVVVAVIIALLAYVWRPAALRGEEQVATPPVDATPRQVVEGYLDALNASQGPA